MVSYFRSVVKYDCRGYWCTLMSKLRNAPPKLYDPLQVIWLAGLLEGEAWIGEDNQGWERTTPSIQISMTDKDVVEHVADLFSVNARQFRAKTWKAHYKDQYRVRATGQRALLILQAILPWFGKRRASVARNLLSKYSHLLT